MIRYSIPAALLLLLGACAETGGTGSYGYNNAGPVADTASLAYFNQSLNPTVLFPVDESALTPQARDQLAEQARWLTQNSEFTAVIEGHADEQGTREYNLALGARRAAAVQEYLVSQGVAASRLRTVTYGKERPLEICSEEACYARNRRAVTAVSAPEGAGV